MEAASVSAARVARRRRRRRRIMRPLEFMSLPTAILVVLFLVPMVILGVISFEYGPFSAKSGFTVTNYTKIVDTSLYAHIALTTVEIATIAMLVQLVVGIPVAYVLAFKARRLEFPLLLFLVLADELNPMVRLYAWRMLLGREGLINSGLQSVGAINQPIDVLLFSKFAVIVVLATSYLTYTIIPIYASMKAVDPRLFEAARDLGASWFHTFRRVLMPLIMPGIFVALLLVYLPLFTDFASPTLVGGTNGYMLGQVVQDFVLENGDLGGGSALSFMLLAASAIFAIIVYRIGKINRLEA